MFTWTGTPLRTRGEIARVVHRVAVARGLDEPATVIALMTISTEVGTGTGDNRTWWCPANPAAAVADSLKYPHDSLSNDNRSMGYFQQQPGGHGEPWWGTVADMMTLERAADTFLSRLSPDYHRAANSPYLAGVYAQQVQRSAFPDRYARAWDEAWDVLKRALATEGSENMPENIPARVGDPVWLEDALRPWLGDRLRTLPGWKDSGVGGTMGRIWGVIWHHTGNARETAQSIRDGRPDLAGPLAQLHIAPDGTVTIVAVGPCNHAGRGSWVGLPQDNANGLTIGVECAWPRDTSITEATQTRERWPDAQIIAMRDTAAALTTYLGVDVSHNISHEEWAKRGPAGVRQDKWDPGNLNMDWFRGEISKAIRGDFKPKPCEPAPTPKPETPEVSPLTATEQRELLDNTRLILDQLVGPDGNGWPQLNGRSMVDAVADIALHQNIPGYAPPARRLI